MEQLSKPFNDCTLAFLEKTFGLIEANQNEALSDWLQRASDMALSIAEQEYVSQLRHLLNENVKHWNEQELSLHFIGPILSKIHFTSPERRFNLFAQRPLAGDVASALGQHVWHLFGKPDEILASGFREPEAPFFCFHEYKREAEPAGDPAGQVLSAMLAGQSLNPIEHPMYGCYVIGRDWYFVALLGRYYTISRDYSAITDDVFYIMRVLKALKEIVKERTATK